MASRRVTWDEVYGRLSAAPPGRLYGIPRGGAIVAGLTGRAVDRPEDADWLVDDVIDSGVTAGRLTAGKPAWGLFDRSRDSIGDADIVFPWDAPQQSGFRVDLLEQLGRHLLEALGYDSRSASLRDTPTRWARWWDEFHQVDPAGMDTTFESVDAGQLVVISGIRVWSVCEHHLLPFFADVAIGYVPRDRLLGLSKFARVAHGVSRRLQLQERIAKEIAEQIGQITGTDDVAVLLRGRHLCMEARGVRTEATASSLSQMGSFERDPNLSARFLSLVHPGHRADAGWTS